MAPACASRARATLVPLLAAGTLLAGAGWCAGAPPAPDIAVVERLAEALPRWVSRGVSGAVLVHAGTGPALAPLPPGAAVALRGMRDRGDVEGIAGAGAPGRDRLYHRGSVARAAWELGVIREVVWVVPAPLPGGEPPEERLHGLLRAAGFADADVAGFAAQGGCFRGLRDGIPVTVCGLDAPAVGQEPALVSVDAAFLLSASAARGISLPSVVRLLVRSLEARLRTAGDAVLASHVEDGLVPVRSRWAVDALAEAVRDPTLVAQPAPPERWALLQRLTDTLGDPRQHADIKALEIAVPKISRWPGDPGLRYLAAEALVRLRMADKALGYAEESCRLDRGWCYGLPELGIQLLDRGDPAAADAFFASGERLRPGMDYAPLDRGLALFRAGRAADARDVFRAAAGRNGAFPAGFFAGVVSAKLGERDEALRCFDEAIAQMGSDAGPSPLDPRTASAMRLASRFLREQGRTREADLLDADPRLQTPPAPAPGP